MNSYIVRVIFWFLWFLGISLVILLAVSDRWMAAVGLACLLAGAPTLYEQVKLRSALVATPLGLFWLGLAVLGVVLLIGSRL